MSFQMMKTWMKLRKRGSTACRSCLKGGTAGLSRSSTLDRRSVPLSRMSQSEWNFAAFVLPERIVLFGRLRCLGGFVVLRLGTVAVRWWGKDLHVPGNDVVGFSLVAVAVFPLPSANGPFDVHLLRFGKVLTTDFGQLPPGHNGVPFGSLLNLAGLVLECLVRRKRKAADCGS